MRPIGLLVSDALLVLVLACAPDMPDLAAPAASDAARTGVDGAGEAAGDTAARDASAREAAPAPDGATAGDVAPAAEGAPDAAPARTDAPADGDVGAADARDGKSDGKSDRSDAGSDASPEAGAGGSDAAPGPAEMTQDASAALTDGAAPEVGPVADAAPAAEASSADGPAREALAPEEADGGDGGGEEATDVGAGEIPAGVRLPRPGDVRMTEILVNPAGVDTNREWFELTSRADEALDLSGLHVADAGTDVAVAAGVLGPHARLVLGASADPLKNGGAPVAFAYGGRVTFNNDADTLSVCLGPCAPATVLDSFTWTGLGAIYDDHALVRDGDRSCPATEPFGTAASYGTPGAADPSCP